MSTWLIGEYAEDLLQRFVSDFEEHQYDSEMIRIVEDVVQAGVTSSMTRRECIEQEKQQ